MATGRIPDANTAPLTAKGDLYTYSTANARLAVGSNGDTLVADSASSTGLRWQGNFAAGKNKVINGDFNIWQRGSSGTFTSGLGYAADRWWGIVSGGAPTCTMSRQTADNAAFVYALRFGRNSGQTGTGTLYLGQTLETADSKSLAGKTVTISFWAKAGANAPTTLNVGLYTGTGTDQSTNTLFNGGGWTSTVNANTTVTITTTSTRYSVQLTLGASISQVLFYFGYTSTGTAGANEWVQIEGVQVEVGNVATAFQTATGTLQGELAACQRYYEQTYVSAATESANKVSSYSDANYTQGTRWKVTKRTAPSVTVYSSNGGTANRIRQISTNTNYTPAAISDIGVDGFNIFTGVGQSNMMDFHYTASSEL